VGIEEIKQLRTEEEEIENGEGNSPSPELDPRRSLAETPLASAETPLAAGEVASRDNARRRRAGTDARRRWPAGGERR
jgi:hypothetical protein